jgi:F-box domain
MSSILMSSPSHWLTLPVEIQLNIIQLLDFETLQSLSLVSRYNHSLSLPAIYKVCFSPPPPLPSPPSWLIDSIPVRHTVIICDAPTIPRSRARCPCVSHSLTRHQHGRLYHMQPHRINVLRCPRSYTFPYSPSKDPLSSSVY